MEENLKISISTREELQRFMDAFGKGYRRACYNVMEGYGFSPCEIDVLIFLSNNPTLDTAKDICRFLDISKALACRSVDSLQQKGLLKAAADLKDRRILRLTLTEKTEEIVARLKESRRAFVEKITADIPNEDAAAFIRVGKLITDRINQMKED